MAAHYLVIACYVLLCTAVWIFLFQWRVARQKKLPVGEKLLRSPGEWLLGKMEQMDERLFFYYLLALGLPAGLLSLLLAGCQYLPEGWTLAGYAVSFVAFFGVLIALLNALAKKMEEYRNFRLGYLGERLVAEHLDVLREHGCRIFHDVPRVEGTYHSNIDHVVVAPFGVYAIETKTFRKNDRRARPDAPPNVVHFDGEKLILPDWSGSGPIRRAKHQAVWLEKVLNDQLDFSVQVMPIITFPFWSVDGGVPASGKLHVCNPGQLRGLIPANPLQEFTAPEFNAVVRELDLLCRDVGL
jgi:hypothetical protein